MPQQTNADNGDWSNAIQSTSLCIAGGLPVSFPAIVVKESQSNALAIHTYPNLDSGYVENLGRNPAKFNVKGLFTNSIFPGIIEGWTPGTLFPNVFQNVITILLNTTSDKTFVHPFYGQINVQVVDWSYEFNAKGPRDGVELDIVLVETIGQSNNVLETTLSPHPGDGVAGAANTLDAAISVAGSPPGLDLSGFFSQIASLISSITSFPQNVVAAIAAPITTIANGALGIGTLLLESPAYISNSVQAIIQNSKNSVLNTYANLSTVAAGQGNSFQPYPNPAPLIAKYGSFSSSPLASTSPANSLPAAIAGVQNKNPYTTFFDSSAQYAVNAIVALNFTTSQNGFQHLDKIMTAVVALKQYYINQNNSVSSPVIVAINQYLLQVQQTQSSLSSNTNNQSVQVSTFVVPVNMTWYQIARYLNNTIDNLNGLNQGLIYDFWVPAFTSINYYQTGNAIQNSSFAFQA